MQAPIALRKRNIQTVLTPLSSGPVNVNSSKRKAPDEAVAPETKKKSHSKSKSIIDLAKDMAKKNREREKEIAKKKQESDRIATKESRRKQWISIQRNRNSKLYQPDIKTIRPIPVKNQQILPCEGACACFLDMKFLITGTPLYIGRKELEFLIIMHKGSVVHTILTGKDADFVVAGTDPDKFKIEKAKKLKIQIIDDGWIFKRLELHNMMDKELKELDEIEIVNDNDFNYQPLPDHKDENNDHDESDRFDFDEEDEDAVDCDLDDDDSENSDSSLSSLDGFIVFNKDIRKKVDHRPEIKKNVSFKSRKTNAKKIDRKSSSDNESNSSSNGESTEEGSSSTESSCNESSSNELSSNED